MNRLFLILLICAALFSGSIPASAKRAAPAAVASVVARGLEFSAPHDTMGFVVAKGISSGKELWRVRIPGIRVNPELERDVQDVFITSLVAKEDTLIITNERGEKYALDLQTRKVTRQ